MMKYQELLKSGETGIAERLIPHKVLQAQKTCELEVARREETVATLQLELEKAKSKHPIDLDAIIAATNNLLIAQKNLATAKAVVDELFGVPK